MLLNEDTRGELKVIPLVSKVDGCKNINRRMVTKQHSSHRKDSVPKVAYLYALQGKDVYKRQEHKIKN